MRKFLLIISFAALCAFLYVHFRPVPPAKIAQPTKDTAIARLSTLVDSHIDSIFSPLEGSAPPTPHHELRQLRGLLADASHAAVRGEQATYNAAVQLCDTLIAAIQERERANLSLADTRSKAYAVGLSQNRLKEEADKRRFFEFTITRRWAENSQLYRNRVHSLYNYIREHERQQLTAEKKP